MRLVAEERRRDRRAVHRFMPQRRLRATAAPLRASLRDIAPTSRRRGSDTGFCYATTLGRISLLLLGSPCCYGSRNPTFAARGNAELAARLVARRRAFRVAYRHAWGEWKRGNRDVVFPFGTYKMRVVYNARCHPPPLAAA